MEPKTSYTVFMSFTWERSDGTVSSRGILSKECFFAWVKARKANLKHPKDSFRRALLAHIRASDGRKPFPEKVEKDLLFLLRRFPKPWSFLNDKSKRGSKRFSNRASLYGYHERKQTEHLKQSKKTTPLPGLQDQISQLRALIHLEQIKKQELFAEILQLGDTLA
eukprot:snap_masked-scaffold_8-processed-gene-12.45-mRNA-1 protein AED:1.00 eAED:1.00 QI:0/-1/0/0/-1/1/1/0/164